MSETTPSVNGNSPDRSQDSGSSVKGRVLAGLTAAHVDPYAACASTGCRLTALEGSAPLLFVEVVELAQLLERSPATFFETDGYTVGYTGSFTAETTNPRHPCRE